MRRAQGSDENMLLTAGVPTIRQGKAARRGARELDRDRNHQVEVGIVRNGVPLLPSLPSAEPVTLAIVNRLRDGGDEGVPRGGGILI